KYYGIDISRKTIDLLNNFVAKKKLSIGSLFCGSMHKTPFKDSYFDIGACVGILEYYEKDFLEKVIIEIHRIMKPNGKFILDIPNIGSPSCRIMFLIEEYLGRPCKFNIIPKEFEEILKDYFEIIENDKDNEFMGLMYFLKCKK
ncbi:MAG: class I SAM-dependent methyltransferase, partial [Treponema sp.]|nr:class I SAM-dependent methyltransferase [Treponema sp.]